MEPGNTVRWGILGTGRILAKITEGFRLAADTARPGPGVQLVAIASRDAARARAAADRWGIAGAFGGYQALLDDPGIDCVLNALHNGLHCEWTVRALEAGKHVLCEKPLACSSAEADRMFAAAHAHRRWLMEGFMYRFHPQLPEARRRIAAGDIGRPLHIECRYLSTIPKDSGPHFWPEAGGGSLMDLGCYGVDLCRFLAAGEPARVTAQAHYDEATGVDLTFHGQLHYDRGLVAQFACSFESEGAYGAEIVGTEAKLTIPHPWRPPTWPAELVITRRGVPEPIRIDAPDGPAHPMAPFALEIEHFSQCVRQNRPPVFPPDTDAEQDSRANLRVIEALHSAAHTHQPTVP